MRINIDDTETEFGNEYHYQGQPFTGEVVETVADGRIVELFAVRNGRENGSSLAWYPDGRPRFEGQYRDGLPMGTHRYWHHNGQIATELVFDERGQTVSTRDWSEEGVEKRT